MPFDPNGTFLRVRNWMQDAAANIRIRADRHDSEDDNFAQGLSQCITKDGRTTISANLPMANYRHTNVGAATAINQYARYDQVQLGKAVWAVAGGTADAITASYMPSTTTPVDGQLYYVRATAANATTTPTFSPDGNTAQVITKYGADELAIGDISGAGHELILRYRLADTKYELLNPAFQSTFSQSISITGTTTESAFIDLFEDTDNGTNKVKLKAPDILGADVTVTLPDASGTLLLESQVQILRNFIDGYTMSTAGASTTMTIGAGQVADSTAALYIKQAASINKTTAAWAVGTDNGGLDTGTIANNTWYRFYAIYRADTGVSDVIFSANGTTPTLPANYTHFAPLWWWKTNGSGQWVNDFVQVGNYFYYKTPTTPINVTNPGTSAQTASLGLPTGYKHKVDVIGYMFDNINISYVRFSDPDKNDVLYQAVAQLINSTGASAGLVQAFQMHTNSSSQVRYKCSSSHGTMNIALSVEGWTDSRGF